MKKQIVFAGILLVLAFTYHLNAQVSPDRPFCGTEQAMAKMPFALKQEMEASATAFQANELMLYLNFNGAFVRPGFGNADTLTSSVVSSPSFCPPPSLTQAQKDEIVRLVSDEFSPFNIRVTADASEFAAYPRQNREMCLITTFPQVIGFSPRADGVSPFAGLGLRLPNDFAFAFSSKMGNDPSDVAAVVSHESAHLLGLGHQHLFGDSCNYLDEYHPPFGTGPLSFAPLMGDAFTDGINNWFAQSCPSPLFGAAQNDYEMINSQVTARIDDFPETPVGDTITGQEVNGVLERAGDIDYIRVSFRNPGPLIVTSENIDLKVSVLTPGGRVVDEYNDPDSPSVTIPVVKGMRYIKVEAASNENMSSQFMTGRYKVTY